MMKIQLVECPFNEATHVYVISERFNRLTPLRLYEIRMKPRSSDWRCSADTCRPIDVTYLIDDYGKEFEGFLTIKGIYLRVSVQ